MSCEIKLKSNGLILKLYAEISIILKTYAPIIKNLTIHRLSCRIY